MNTTSVTSRAAYNQEHVRELLAERQPVFAAILERAAEQVARGVAWTTESRTGRVAPEQVVYDFFLELRPPYASDLNPSAYLHARGATREEAIASLRNVPATWSVYVKRQRLVESRTCASCGSEEEVKHRGRKHGFGWVVFLDCGHFQGDDEH